MANFESVAMFGLFRKDPLKKLQAEYARRLESARDLQRKGDIKGYAAMSAEADELLRKIDQLEAESTDNR